MHSRDIPQWIPVRERLPPKDEPVVYARPNGPERWHVGVAYWTVSQKWNPEAESRFAPYGFTHWMPLPEPPLRATTPGGGQDAEITPPAK
jgi:hypothetical protein